MAYDKLAPTIKRRRNQNNLAETYRGPKVSECVSNFITKYGNSNKEPAWIKNKLLSCVSKKNTSITPLETKLWMISGPPVMLTHVMAFVSAYLDKFFPPNRGKINNNNVWEKFIFDYIMYNIYHETRRNQNLFPKKLAILTKIVKTCPSKKFLRLFLSSKNYLRILMSRPVSYCKNLQTLISKLNKKDLDNISSVFAQDEWTAVNSSNKKDIKYYIFIGNLTKLLKYAIKYPDFTNWLKSCIRTFGHHVLKGGTSKRDIKMWTSFSNAFIELLDEQCLGGFSRNVKAKYLINIAKNLMKFEHPESFMDITKSIFQMRSEKSEYSILLKTMLYLSKNIDDDIILDRFWSVIYNFSVGLEGYNSKFENLLNAIQSIVLYDSSKATIRLLLYAIGFKDGFIPYDTLDYKSKANIVIALAEYIRNCNSHANKFERLLTYYYNNIQKRPEFINFILGNKKLYEDGVHPVEIYEAIERIGKEKVRVLHDMFNISYFSRYSTDILEYAYKLAKDPSLDRNKPLALAIVAKVDWNGWFRAGHMFHVDPKFRSLIVEVSSKEQLSKYMKKINKSYGNINVLIITMHGQPDQANLGSSRLKKSHISPWDKRFFIKNNLNECMAYGNSIVILNSCETARNVILLLNESIAQTVSDGLQTEVIAPESTEAFITPRLNVDGNGKISADPIYLYLWPNPGFELGGKKFMPRYDTATTAHFATRTALLSASYHQK